jgi:hypothetical protein
MRRLRWFCALLIGGLVALSSVPGSAQDKTAPEAKKVDLDPKKTDTKKTEPEAKKVDPDPKKTEPEPKKVDPDPKKVDSTSVPRGFRMYLVADGRFELKDERYRVGKLHDPVTEYGLKTVIGVFVRGIPKEGNDPVVAVMKRQQELAKKYEAQRLAGFVAFLALKKDFAADDDRYKQIAEVSAIAKGAETPLLSIGLAELTIAKEGGDAEGAVQTPPQVAAWDIGPEDAITIVFYHRFKIVKRWKFPVERPPTEADLKDISDTVDAFMHRSKK